MIVAQDASNARGPLWGRLSCRARWCNRSVYPTGARGTALAAAHSLPCAHSRPSTKGLGSNSRHCALLDRFFKLFPCLPEHVGESAAVRTGQPMSGNPRVPRQAKAFGSPLSFQCDSDAVTRAVRSVEKTQPLHESVEGVWCIHTEY